MPTGAERQEIYDALEPFVGSRPATLIMDALTPADTLRGEMAQLRGDLRTEMAGLRTEMADMRTEVADVKVELAKLNGRFDSLMPRLVLANFGMAMGTAGLVLASARFA
jgi:hypothetical protein